MGLGPGVTKWIYGLTMYILLCTVWSVYGVLSPLQEITRSVYFNYCTSWSLIYLTILRVLCFELSKSSILPFKTFRTCLAPRSSALRNCKVCFGGGIVSCTPIWHLWIPKAHNCYFPQLFVSIVLGYCPDTVLAKSWTFSKWMSEIGELEVADSFEEWYLWHCFAL